MEEAKEINERVTPLSSREMILFPSYLFPFFSRPISFLVFIRRLTHLFLDKIILSNIYVYFFTSSLVGIKYRKDRFEFFLSPSLKKSHSLVFVME